MTSNHVFLPAESFVGWRLPDAVEPSRCAELIDMLVTHGFEPTGARYPGDYRNNDRLVFDDPALSTWLFERTRDRLPAELTIDGERWILDGLNPRFRACRYTGGQSFCIHRDGPYAPEPGLRSHLTLQLYLDADPSVTGGRTRFYADPRGESLWASIEPCVGTAIVFDHRAWHDGESVTGGIKHVLRTDVIYRRVAVTTAPTTDNHVLYKHRGYAWHALVCRDGSIASAGRDGTVHIRREGTTSADATIDLGAGSVTRLVEAHDGRLWCGTRAGMLFVIEGLRATPIAHELGAILDLAARPGGGIIAATALGELVALERNGTIAWRTRAHDGWAWSVIPDSTGYLSTGHGGQIVAVDESGHATELARLDTPVRALALVGDELWAGDTNGTLHRIARDGRTLSAWSAHRGAITGIANRRDGLVMSGAEDGCVRVWTGSTSVSTFTAGDFVTSVAEDRSGRIVCASYDGAIYRAPLATHETASLARGAELLTTHAAADA